MRVYDDDGRLKLYAASVSGDLGRERRKYVSSIERGGALPTVTITVEHDFKKTPCVCKRASERDDEKVDVECIDKDATRRKYGRGAVMLAKKLSKRGPWFFVFYCALRCFCCITRL